MVIDEGAVMMILLVVIAAEFIWGWIADRAQRAIERREFEGSTDIEDHARWAHFEDAMSYAELITLLIMIVMVVGTYIARNLR